jgi:transcriptional regulator with XRE-family HTH domain
MDLSLSKPSEIVKLLCERLRKERLAQQMTQAEVAARAGIGVNTLSNLEAGRNTTFESVVRIAMVLGCGSELENLFKPKLDSLDDILRYDNSAKRQRAQRKSGHVEAG